MSNQTPVQNRVEEGLPPSPPPPGSQTPPPPPASGDQTNTHAINSDESIFFETINYKKLYFSTLKVLLRLVKSQSRVWFLQKCVSLKILPNNSKVKHHFNERAQNSTQRQINDNLESVSLNNLKLSLQDERQFGQTCKNDFRVAKMELHSVIKEPNLHIYIEERLDSDKLKFCKQLSNKHKQKLCHLLKKVNRQVPTFLQRDFGQSVTRSKKY